MALARKKDSDDAIAYVLQLAAEHGQCEAARAFGFSQAYVSRLSRGAVARLRQQTVDVIERVRAGEGPTASPSAAPPSVYDLVRRMDARELRAFRAWVLAWTDEGPDAA